MAEGIAYTVQIKEVATGRVVEYHDTWPENPDHPASDGLNFMWEDGNYSCDCNREIFFDEAQGKPRNTDTKCGHSRFFCKVMIDGTGEVVLDELQ